MDIPVYLRKELRKTFKEHGFVGSKKVMTRELGDVLQGVMVDHPDRGGSEPGKLLIDVRLSIWSRPIYAALRAKQLENTPDAWTYVALLETGPLQLVNPAAADYM